MCVARQTHRSLYNVLDVPFNAVPKDVTIGYQRAIKKAIDDADDAMASATASGMDRMHNPDERVNTLLEAPKTMPSLSLGPRHDHRDS